MKTIILIRHGESETNVQKVFTGQLDAALTPTGHRQAQLMAQYLDNYHIDKIYASPLKRAVDTAQALAQRQHCPIEQQEALKEIYAGVWQGLTFEEIAERYPGTYQTWRTDFANAQPDEGENCQGLYHRVTEFLERVLTEKEDTVCFVCHATPIRMLESHICGQSASAAQNISWVPNASVTIYEYDGAFRCVKRGCCDYLGELSTNLPKSI